MPQSAAAGFGGRAARHNLQRIRKSAIVLVTGIGPVETRKPPVPSPYPIAESTWLGPTFPDEQADPADSAIPARSKAICTVSAFISASENIVVLRQAVNSLAIDNGVGRYRANALFDHFAFLCWPAAKSRRSLATRAAAPNPAISGKASVPPRWPFSCPPPRIERLRHHKIRHAQRSRQRLLDRRSCATRRSGNPQKHVAISRGMRPAACTASTTKIPPNSFTSAPIVSIGCTMPVSLLAACTATSGRPGCDHARQEVLAAAPDQAGRAGRHGNYAQPDLPETSAGKDARMLACADIKLRKAHRRLSHRKCGVRRVEAASVAPDVKTT